MTRFNNRTIVWLGAIIIFLSSCLKQKLDTTVARVAGQISIFQELLTSSEDGWLVHLESPIGGRYNFWMLFDVQGRVTMIGDFESAQKELQSAYEVKQLQQPTLIFTTYNHLSVLADPDLDRGNTTKTDIQYAFTESLADTLKIVKDLKSIERFEMRGRLHGSKATFYRANAQRSKQNILRIYKTEQSLAQIQPKKSAAILTIGINNSSDVYNTVHILQAGNREYHYNLQISRGNGNIYNKLFAFTNIKTKRAVPMTYYFDIDARMHFMPAPNAVRTILARDKNMETRIRNWVLTFPENISNDKQEYPFTKTDSSGKNIEKGKLTTKHFLEIGYQFRRRDSMLWKRRLDPTVPRSGWRFMGMEKLLKKDATGLGRTLFLLESRFFKGFSTSYLFVTSDYQTPGAFVIFLLHTAGSTLLVTVGGDFFVNPDLSSKSSMETLAKGLGYTENTPPVMNLKNQNYQSYALLPVCLGFEWHHLSSGDMLPFYTYY